MWAIPPVILWEPRNDEPLSPPKRFARQAVPHKRDSLSRGRTDQAAESQTDGTR